jgi:putative membrane protein
MATLVRIMLLFVALQHIGFMLLETVFWQTPFALQLFHLTAAQAATPPVPTLAANQGIYNGFLAVGLILGLARGNKGLSRLFLSFVVVAGVFGALTADPKILFVQAAPAAFALLASFCPRAAAAFKSAD